MIRSSAPSSGCERSSRWQADPGWSAGHCQGSGWRGRRWYDGGADRRWGPEAASPPGGLGIAAVPAEAAAAGSCRGRRSAGAAPRAAERRYMYIYIYIFFLFTMTITITLLLLKLILIVIVYIYIYIYIYMSAEAALEGRGYTRRAEALRRAIPVGWGSCNCIILRFGGHILGKDCQTIFSKLTLSGGPFKTSQALRP